MSIAALSPIKRYSVTLTRGPVGSLSTKTVAVTARSKHTASFIARLGNPGAWHSVVVKVVK